MSVSVTDDDRLWREIENDLKTLNRSHTKVGFLDGGTREDDPKLTNAQVAVFNEYGTAHFSGTIYTNGTPARPFMRPAIAENLDEIVQMQEEGYSDVIRQMSTVKTELARIGTFAQREIQRKIRDVKTPPNEASTIKRKGSSDPLINTSEMRQAVSHEEVL